MALDLNLKAAHPSLSRPNLHELAYFGPKSYSRTKVSRSYHLKGLFYASSFPFSSSRVITILIYVFLVFPFLVISGDANEMQSSP